MKSQKKGSKFQLYFVELESREDFNIYRIQDQADCANYFLFDLEWMGMSENY